MILLFSRVSTHADNFAGRKHQAIYQMWSKIATLDAYCGYNCFKNLDRVSVFLYLPKRNIIQCVESVRKSRQIKNKDSRRDRNVCLQLINCDAKHSNPFFNVTIFYYFYDNLILSLSMKKIHTKKDRTDIIDNVMRLKHCIIRFLAAYCLDSFENQPSSLIQ